MANPVLEKIAGIVKELPSLPTVAQEVLHQLSVPGTHPTVLQNIMSRDPSLSLKVLRLANSAYYRRGGEISSLSDAIVLLGFKTIQSLVLSTAVQQVLNSAGSVAPKLWEHCFAVALSCRQVASHSGLSLTEREEAFLAGLFHDVAKGVIASRFSGIYNTPKSVEDERDLLGFDHAQLGQVLLFKWQIPAALSEAVGGHHNPPPDSLAGLIRLGNYLCEPVAPGTAPIPRGMDQALLAAWNIDDSNLDELRDAIETLVKEERSAPNG